MTDKAISPLRRRLIEDMTIRRLGRKAQRDYIGYFKSCADTSAGLSTKPLRRTSVATSCAGVDRNDCTDRQRQCHRPAVLLQGHAEAPRSCRRGRVGPRAALPSRLPVVLSPEEVDRLLASTTKHQAQGGPEPDLCYRPAVIGGRITQAHRYRQRPNGHPGRAGQGQEGPVCHSLAEPS